MLRPKTHYRHSCPRIAREIRDLYFKARFRQTELARLYGLAQGTVSKMISGITWQ